MNSDFASLLSIVRINLALDDMIIYICHVCMNVSPIRM